MAALQLRISSLVLSCVFVIGCPKDDPTPTSTGPAAATGPGATPIGTPDAVPRAGFERLEPREMTAIGAQEGFVQGGMIHAALRTSIVLPWLRAIPLPSEVARELAELSEDSGFDWRAENLERRFSLTPDAVISMTLLRPITTDAAELRSELLRGGAVLDALGAAMGAEAPTVHEIAPMPPHEEAAKPVEEKPEERSGPMVVEPPSAYLPSGPKPVALTGAEIEWGKTLLGKATALGLHSRFAVQVTDPRPLVDHVRKLTGERGQSRWAKVCAAVSNALCFGDEDVVAIMRGTDKAVLLDVLMFVTDSPDVTESQRKIVTDAVTMTALTSDVGLRGDAAAVIEASVITRFVELDALRRALNNLRYGGEDRDTRIRSSIDEAVAFAELASVTQLFSGARLDAAIDGENVHAEARWLIVPGQEKTAAKVFEVAASSAKIPAIAGLCDGALFCFRTAGLPRPSTLAEQLGIGAWSRGPNAADSGVGTNDEALVSHVLAASWPNALGSAARIPALEFGGGPEGAVATNVLDMIGRVQSTGGSLRSATVSQRHISADYVLYARTSATDAAIPRGMLALAGESMRDVTLPGDGGPASEFTVPEDDFPATIISRPDPAVLGVPSTTGWLGIVDAPDRMSWLLALPMESHSGPGAYAEVPDLGRFLPVVPELARELEPIRGFLDRRSLRASLTLDGAEPVLRAVLARTP